MAKKCWVFINGEMIPKEDYTPPVRQVMPDLPDFVSPIDRKVYHGRAGMREHNARHNVVPTADLAGLPVKQGSQPLALSASERKERKEQIIRVVNQHWKN